MEAFEDLVEAGLDLEVMRSILIIFYSLLGITGVTLTFVAYQKIQSGNLHFGPTDVQASHALLAGFIGIYLMTMLVLKACRLPATLEGAFLGFPLGVAGSFLLLQKMNVPMHVFVDADTVIAAIVLLGIAAWMPYPAKA